MLREKVKTGKDYIELKRLQAKLLMHYFRNPLEGRLEAEEKLYHISKKISSLVIPLSLEELQEACKLDKIMGLYKAYHSSGSAMEQSIIYEVFTKCIMTRK
jgi:hypothetical protein